MSRDHAVISAAADVHALRKTDRMAADAQADSEEGEVSFSRPTMSVLGKNSCVLKTTVPDVIDEIFKRKSRLAGFANPSDCLRELAMLFALGEQGLKDVHNKRIDSLAQNTARTGIDS